MSKTLTMCINTISKVKDFVNKNMMFNGEVSVASGRFIIDGKSIMGMFSLDLTKEVEVTIEGEDASAIDALIASYKEVGI